MDTDPVQGGEMKEAAATKDVQRILECPVCASVPMPPIFNCATGHIICGECRPKLAKCGICQAELTDSRNFVLEEIVQASRIACEFREQGCGLILPGAGFQAHVKKCEYRPIDCVFGAYHDCNRSVVKFKDYAVHLATVHKFLRKELFWGAADQSYCLQDSASESVHWSGMYVVFQGRAFFSRTFLRKNLFHFGVCVLDSETEASKFSVRMVFAKSDPPNSDPIWEVTMPVLPIRKTDEEIIECMHHMLPKAVMRRAFGSGGNPEKIAWKINYKILAKVTSGCSTM